MPDNLRAAALSTHSIRLTWSIRLPSSESAEIEVIDGFYIGYRAISGNGLIMQQSGDSGSGSGSSSYTYKTISNTPLQQLYSGSQGKVPNGGGTSNSWPTKYYRQSSPSSLSPSFLVQMNTNRSLMMMMGDGPSMDYRSKNEINGGINHGIHHQYYEHIIDTLTRQTQYQ